MALVAYDCSDESDDDGDHLSRKNLSHSFVRNNVQTSFISHVDSDDDKIGSTVNMTPTSPSDTDSEEDGEVFPISFSKLRKPTHNTIKVDVSKIKTIKSDSLKKLLHLPSEGKTYTKLKNSAIKSDSGRGLLSMLPTPTTDFNPPVFKSIKEDSNPSSSLKLLPRSLQNNTSKKILNDSDEDDDVDTDFFSLTATDTTKDLPAIVDMEALRKDIENCTAPTEFQRVGSQQTVDNVASHRVILTNEKSVNRNTEDESGLDEEAVQVLFGGLKRRGQVPVNIQVIDIHEDNILAETRRNLTKQLTEEYTYRPTAKKFSGPSSLGKRKHQITYLAYQAKEREMELKNQWANSRLSRKQTQSKYGFI